MGWSKISLKSQCQGRLIATLIASSKNASGACSNGAMTVSRMDGSNPWLQRSRTGSICERTFGRPVRNVIPFQYISCNGSGVASPPVNSTTRQYSLRLGSANGLPQGVCIPGGVDDDTVLVIEVCRLLRRGCAEPLRLRETGVIGVDIVNACGAHRNSNTGGVDPNPGWPTAHDEDAAARALLKIRAHASPGIKHCIRRTDHLDRIAARRQANTHRFRVWHANEVGRCSAIITVAAHAVRCGERDCGATTGQPATAK